MYDIKPLEEEWKKYKNKKRRPYYILAALLTIALIAMLAFMNKKEFTLPQMPSFTLNSEEEPALEPSSNILLDDSLTALQVKKTEIIEEIKPTVRLQAEENIETAVPTLPVVEDIPVLEEVKPKKNVKKVYSKPVKKQRKVEKPRKKMHLNIIESSSVSAYKDVEKRFYESHDTDDSLFLAKSYFRKGKYKKAEYWALQTNKVNQHIEDSWLIYAKAKVKLGRKNEAIRVLTNYVKMSHSQRAKNLLNKLKK